MCISVIISEVKRKRFENIYNEYFSLVKHVCCGYLGDEELSTNTVQDVFVTFWNNMDMVKELSERNFLLTIAKNKCLNILRHKIVEQKYKEHSLYNMKLDLINLSALEHSTSSIYCKEIEKIIHNEVNKFPDSFIRTFHYKVFEGLSNKKISLIEDVSERTIEYRLRKINLALKERLKEYIK